MSATTAVDEKPDAPAANGHVEQPVRQPSRSREDLESAEMLNLLNKSNGRFFSELSEAAAQQPHSDAPMADAERPSIAENRTAADVPEYHSLDDVQPQDEDGDQNVPPPDSDTTDLPQRSHVSTAPMTGQVCRYATPFISRACVSGLTWIF